MKAGTTISCIGTGAMGGAIMRAVCKKFPECKITVTDKNQDEARAFAKENGCSFAATNSEAAGSKYIFLAVKPQFLGEVVKDICSQVTADSVVISMAAGIPVSFFSGLSCQLVRMMPNVCAQIGQAMTAVTRGPSVRNPEFDVVKELLSAAGRVEEVPERLMDCVTAVSGSGPAFVFMFIEALADAAVRCGMPRAQAYTYAAQTVKGSAQLVLETEKNPAVLKDSVCSPAGTTIEGVAALEENGFRNSVIKAVSAAYEKSVQLGSK